MIWINILYIVFVESLTIPAKLTFMSVKKRSCNVMTLLKHEPSTDHHEKLIPEQGQEEDITNHNQTRIVMVSEADRRPYEQRRNQPRKARRLNHSFQHLYRHEHPMFDDAYIASKSYVMTHVREYLHVYGLGYSWDMIHNMCKQFPPLDTLHVLRHVRPKMRFLKYTLLISFQNTTVSDIISVMTNRTTTATTKRTLSSIVRIPPQYFGSRLERTIAPRHAYLIHVSLPHGLLLFQWKNTQGQSLFIDFLQACRQDKAFIQLCKEWRKLYGFIVDPNYPKLVSSSSSPQHLFADTSSMVPSKDPPIHDPNIIDIPSLLLFDTTFQRGILSAARNEMIHHNNNNNDNSIFQLHPEYPSKSKLHSFISSEQMIYLLIRHGANPFETDIRDISLYHWAAGSGNVQGLKILIQMTLSQGLEEALQIKAHRDGATLLHWAATGAQAKNFGTGGHYDVCRYFLDFFLVQQQQQQQSSSSSDPSVSSSSNKKLLHEKDVVNACTKDGNSVLMWAAWSGSFDVVKLLIRHRADVLIQNRNGCTVAHWAASGGNLELCRYLYDILGVDFSIANYAGNTPLSHAMAYGRKDVVRWLLEEVGVQDVGDRARLLAIDMMQWSSGSDDAKENKDVTMDLFGDYEYSSEDDHT